MKKQKNIEAIYQILCLIDYHFEQETFPNFSQDPVLKELNISENRINLILIGLLNYGLIEGVAPISRSGNVYNGVKLIAPRLTIEGMNYLQDNSAMKRAIASLESMASISGLLTFFR